MKRAWMTTFAALAALVLVSVVTVPARSAEKQNSGKAAREKPAPEGKIVGIEIARANGNWLGLSIKNECFRLGFYDAHKMPIAPDCVRAVARWHSRTKIYQDSSVLERGADGVSLQGNQFVRPPRLFKVYLTLIGDGDQALETYVVDFHE